MQVPAPMRPPSTTSRSARLAVVGIATVVLLAVGTVVALAGGSDSPQTPSYDATNAAPQMGYAQDPATGPAYATRTPATPTTASTPPSPADEQAAALAQLRLLHDQDAGAVRFDGQYVAQLASKNAGIVDQYQTAADGTHTFLATDILAEHLTLRRGDNPGATVVLLLSTDYGKRQLYNGAPLWVTVAIGGFGSAAGVSAWCAQRFPALSGVVLQDSCTPRRLEPANA